MLPSVKIKNHNIHRHIEFSQDGGENQGWD
jgi:hypothetical protein